MTAEFGPCSDWPTTFTCDVSTVSPVLTGYAASTATRVLWSLSGRRYGTCTTTLRPCRKTCYDVWPWGWSQWDDTQFPSTPWPDWRYWFPLSCGQCLSSCSCSDVSEAVLPSPVSSIVSVKLDGTPMATGSYRVDNNRLLVRTDGQRWPICNDLSKDDSQVGTWSVTAAYGQDVPTGARLAMGELVCEIIRAASGQDCRLPAGVTSLARQGVTIQIPDFGELFKDGRTGLYLVDMFLASENPDRLKSRARVYSVDRPTQRRTNT